MSVVGMPSSTTTGSTYCVTVTGVKGTLTAGGSGSVGSVTAVQTGRPDEWTVCFTVGAGLGGLNLEGSGGGARYVAMRGQ